MGYGLIEIFGEVALRGRHPMLVISGEARLIEATYADALSSPVAAVTLVPGPSPVPFRLSVTRNRIRVDERYLLAAAATGRAEFDLSGQTQRFETTVSHPWDPMVADLHRLTIDPVN